MNNNKLIAEVLLDIARNSTTEFIEDAKLDKKIKDAASKIGLELPNPDIAVFRTVWAKIDSKNLNGVRLTRKVVEDGLKTILFKQVNWEHEGSGFICGVTIDAEIENDKIITTNILYKSLFPEQFEELKEKVKTGEAAVSFEIWSIHPETKKSLIKTVADGVKEFTQMIIHGTGLLLCNPPAEPSARIFSLVAKNLTDTAEKFVNNAFDKNLIYASLAVENNKKEEKIMTKCEKCGKEFETSAEEKICVECASLPKEEPKAQPSDETKPIDETKPVEGAETKPKGEETKEVKLEETPKVESEAKVEEPKVEEKAEEKKEDAQPLEVIEPKIVVKVTRIYSDLFVDTYSADGTMSGTSEGKSSFKTITEYTDGTKDEVAGESEYKKKYDFAELEEKVNTTKSEKDAEIATLKAEQERILAEKDTVIKNKTLELGQKDQEIVELKNPKVEVKKEKEMTVGAVDVEKKSDIKKQADNINDIIANKGK